MTDVAALLGCAAIMTVFVAASIWYFTRIRDGRADPVIDPSWTTNMLPASPPPRLFETRRTEEEQHQQVQDDEHLLVRPDDDKR